MCRRRKLCVRERTAVRSRGTHFLKAVAERRERRLRFRSVTPKTNTSKSYPPQTFVLYAVFLHWGLKHRNPRTAVFSARKYGNARIWVISAHVQDTHVEWIFFCIHPLHDAPHFRRRSWGRWIPLLSLSELLRVLCTRLQSQCCIYTTLTTKSGATTARQNIAWEASGGALVDTGKISVRAIETKILLGGRLPLRDRYSSTRAPLQSRLCTLRLCRVSEVRDVYSATEQEIILSVVLRSRTVIVCT